MSFFRSRSGFESAGMWGLLLGALGGSVMLGFVEIPRSLRLTLVSHEALKGVLMGAALTGGFLVRPRGWLEALVLGAVFGAGMGLLVATRDDGTFIRFYASVIEGVILAAILKKWGSAKL